MKSISLAEALKVKSRLSARLVDITSILLRENSHPVNQPSKYRIAEYAAEHTALNDALIKISAIIQIANGPIAFQLAKLAFNKGRISTLDTMMSGAKVGTYLCGEKEVSYTCEVSPDAIRKDREKTQNEIHDDQDAIDKHNASTMVEVPDEVVQLSRAA